jgi:hypothetical protein
MKGLNGEMSRCMMLSRKTWLYVPMKADMKVTRQVKAVELPRL